MKSLRRMARLAAVGIVMALRNSLASAQSYYSLQHTNWPPFPFLPFEVPVLDLGDGIFAFDDLSVDYDQLRALQHTMMQGENEPPPPPGEGGGEGEGDVQVPAAYDFTTNDLWVEIVLVTNKDISLIIHAPDTNAYDLYRTFELIGSHATNSVWRWVGKGTNGQSQTFLNVRCRHAFYMLGSGVDSDSDGLANAFEVLSSRTSPATNHTYSAELTDLEWWLRSNILVNDPEQDCGNEQNSQFETTVAVLGNNVIVAWVDSNQGVNLLGAELYPQDPFWTNRTPRLVGYAISRDGGVTFQDTYVPPLARAGNPTNDDGDAGDPVLAVDQASGIVYLAGTSARNNGSNGIPVWKSTDGGVTFSSPVIAREDMFYTDKPWIAVDNTPGTGQHDVYLACTKVESPYSILLTVSTNGDLQNWSAPQTIQHRDGTNVSGVNSVIPVIGPDHVAYVFWFERTGVSSPTNWLKMRRVENRGGLVGEIQIVQQLGSGELALKRSNTALSNDTFRAFPFPVPAVNPATNKLGHLYVAYGDRGTNANDKADIFVTCSTNHGTNWTPPQRVNLDATTNDQWMPVLAVKPDGTKLFIGWYDRRSDTNNSLIDVYGRFGTISTNGSVSFGSEFVISTTSFPPVFAGALTNNMEIGHYDPVYPPGGVSLHWHYEEWPTNVTTLNNFVGHVGEYNGVWARQQDVIMTWTDYRLTATCTMYPRNQSDIRFARFNWP